MAQQILQITEIKLRLNFFFYKTYLSHVLAHKGILGYDMLAKETTP